MGNAYFLNGGAGGGHDSAVLGSKSYEMRSRTLWFDAEEKRT
jgi:hypothetical protein